ncbi:SLAP domain-containing protein [Psychrobacillus glaciei]|uniref:SLAP domain-containing protein n=1 Tax=Psychrobacillus glaciei TaxID=2283160 RepID=A0A5J6SJD2_9BACI|nr:SLAP domain-containing protein [Psychrobacillus glaciei]QFF97995.1 SLAP domain-containing protein [Psychrobacillus glaciei]
MFKSNNAPQPKSANTLKTTLEFSDLWNLNEKERYAFQAAHNKLKGLIPNQISIHGVKLHKTNDGFIMTAIIRQSLQKNLALADIRLIVRDTDGKDIAKKDFNMEYYGELASLRARPWMFEFDNEFLLVSHDEIMDQMEFEVVFEYEQESISHFSLQLDEKWSQELTDEQKDSLKKTLDSLNPLAVNDISISTINLTEQENGVTIDFLIRNSFNKGVTLNNIPLQLFDAAEDMVAQYDFLLEQFDISPNYGRPVSLFFPKEIFKKENPDWTKWKIETTSN